MSYCTPGEVPERLVGVSGSEIAERKRADWGKLIECPIDKADH